MSQTIEEDPRVKRQRRINSTTQLIANDVKGVGGKEALYRHVAVIRQLAEESATKLEMAMVSQRLDRHDERFDELMQLMTSLHQKFDQFVSCKCAPDSASTVTQGGSQQPR